MMVKPNAKKWTNMANYNLKPGGNKANIVVGIISAIFLIAGITLIVIANFTELVSWLKTFGIVHMNLLTNTGLFRAEICPR